MLAALASLWAGYANAQTAAAPASTNPPPAAVADGTALTPPLNSDVYDPWERMNRSVFRANKRLDQAIIRPLALGYKAALPGPVRTGVRNAIDNIGEPLTFLNDMLELRFANGGRTATRFAINSTAGVLGLFDVAGKIGIPIHYADFGETLGRYGVPQGPYLYLPLLGPSSVRDGAGRIVDIYTGLLNLHELHVNDWDRLAIAGVDGLDTRAEFDDQLTALATSATDEYATQRSIYLQNRKSLVTNPDSAIQQLPDFDGPPDANAAEPAKPPHRRRGSTE